MNFQTLLLHYIKWEASNSNMTWRSPLSTQRFRDNHTPALTCDKERIDRGSLLFVSELVNWHPNHSWRYCSCLAQLPICPLAYPFDGSLDGIVPSTCKIMQRSIRMMTTEVLFFSTLDGLYSIRSNQPSPDRTSSCVQQQPDRVIPWEILRASLILSPRSTPLLWPRATMS